MGYDVDGVDSSADMLARLKQEAAESGLTVNVFEADVSELDLDRRYRAIYIAGASMTLLPDDETAQKTLNRFAAHLLPGGSVMIPLEIEQAEDLNRAIGFFKEDRLANGELVRCGMTEVDCDEQARHARITLRYERHSTEGKEVVERVWERHWWDQDQFRDMLETAGFDRITCLDPAGGKAGPDATTFVFLAQKNDS